MPGHVNTSLLHWNGEKDRLESSTIKQLRQKAARWLHWRTAPKSSTLLRHALAKFVDATIAELQGAEAPSDANVAMPVTIGQLPSTSHPVSDQQAVPDRPLAADVPPGDGADGSDLQHVSAMEQQAPTGTAALLEKMAQENVWLRRAYEQALRALPATGATQQQGEGQAPPDTRERTPAEQSPEPNSSMPAGASQELVFFGLPLEAGASHRDASIAVQRFCSETLQLPETQLPDIVRVRRCRLQRGGFTTLRPATVVVARLAVQQARAICEAKLQLDSSCLVSIDKERTIGERQQCQERRRQRREVGQAGEEGAAQEGRQAGGDERLGDGGEVHATQ